jgi:hypothetical protein
MPEEIAIYTGLARFAPAAAQDRGGYRSEGVTADHRDDLGQRRQVAENDQRR